MYPGSGPSDRHNDVYFPPIRTMLQDAGCAVASFDKRGVGGSSGSLGDASVERQADDLLACVSALGRHLRPGLPVGAFGHSQGGWVVYEAAARRQGLEFVVANSGPGVSVIEQERFASSATFREDDQRADAHRALDVLHELATTGSPFAEVTRRLESEVSELVRERFGWLIASEEVWRLTASLLRYDPAPALGSIDVPVLAMFGRDDVVVPVQASVERLRRLVAPDLLRVAVLPGDHRLLDDLGNLPADYAETLGHFLDHVA